MSEISVDRSSETSDTPLYTQPAAWAPKEGEMNSQTEPERCFACERELKRFRHEAMTADGQRVLVGPECNGWIARNAESGYQPPLGGPRLYPMPAA